MKRIRNASTCIIFLMFAIVLTWCLALPNGQVGAATSPSWIQAASGQVNLRQGPSSTYNMVGILSPGTVLQVLAQDKDWYKVRTESGGQAWVASWLVIKAAAPTAQRTSTITTTANETVKVFVNRQLQSFDVPPMIENGRTMVPLRAIFTTLGAAVAWDEDTQTVTAQKSGTTIVLPIGSLNPTVNGQAQTLDVPAKVVNGRTLAPLGFVGRALGGQVSWDAADQEVYIDSPPQPGDNLTSVMVASSEVNLRSSASTSSNKVGSALLGTKMPVSGVKDGWYNVVYQGQSAWVAGWLVTPVWNSSSSDNTTQPTQPAAPSGDLLSIRYSKDSDGLRLTMESSSSHKVDIQENPGSISYTFPGCYLQQETNIQESLGNASLSITGRSSNGSVLVQASLPSGVGYKKSSENGGKRQVFFVPNCITGVERDTFASSGEQLTISTLLPFTYTSQQSGNTMTIRLPGVGKGLAQTSYAFSSSSLKSLQIEQQSDGTAIITIQNPVTVKYSLGQSDDEKTLNILFIAKSDIPARNSLVVLDPGHGGTEIGSCGANLAEKDVNLDITLRVGAILTKKGIHVEYTHNDDSTVGLKARSDIANLLNPKLFVSIHNNAVDNHDVMGTETFFYAPVSNPDLYIQKDEREQLAAAIQQRLISSLGRPDRGVKQSNLSVLRLTDTVCALTEVAFISNPTEENLLAQESFKQKAAQAIADGIAACMSGTAQNPSL